MRRILVVLAVLTLGTAGCGDDDGKKSAQGDGSKTQGTTTGPQEFTVTLEPKTEEFNVEWATFFPDELRAHPGDRIRFLHDEASGIPHTVTLGTLIDQALAKSATLSPETPIPMFEKVMADLKVPDPFPHGVPAGPPMMNQSAAQPCYLASGTPPFNEAGGAPACPKVEQPAFDGTQALYNSGIISESGEAFEVELADTIKPGTYQMVCLVHRQPMNGRITVVAAAEDVPSPAEVMAAAKDRRETLLALLRPLAEKAKQATAAAAVGGIGDPAAGESIVAEFGPKEVSVPVGGTVTWNTFGFHSIAFNAEDSDVGIVQKGADGSWQIALKGAAPAGINTPPEAGQFPPGPRPVTVNAGAWDGSGFRSTGIMGSLPPQIVSVKQAFKKAGTYTVRCLFHPDMRGQVKVG
jgi:plastocyanin